MTTTTLTSTSGFRKVRCPHCSKAIWWQGHESDRFGCPVCATRVIVRPLADGTVQVGLENDDTVAGMICNWLRPDPEEDDDV